ncbi:MAG: glycosyltransferase family 87 protein [Kiritimatiellia bacterium]
MSKSSKKRRKKQAAANTASQDRAHPTPAGSLKLRYAILVGVVYVLAGLAMKLVAGAYYQNCDPSYAYLFNILNLLTGYPIDHIDHPGTTLHVLGWLAVPAIRLLSPFRESTIQNALILHPEFYLNGLNVTILILVALASVVFYRSVHRAGRTVPEALMTQALPLCFFETYLALYDVKPEPLLLALILGMGAVLVSEYCQTYNRQWTSVAGPPLLGVLIGLSLMLKITAAPLVLLVFFPRRLWRKSCCFCATAITCSALFILLLPKLAKMKHWYSGLIMNSGTRGSGERGFPSLSTLAGKMASVILNAPVFTILAAVLCALVLLHLFAGRRGKNSRTTGTTSATDRVQNRQTLLLIVVLALQAAIVMRHPLSARYLIPSMALLPVLLCIVLHAVQHSPSWALGKRLYEKRLRLTVVITAVALSVLCVKFTLEIRYRTRKRQENKRADAIVAELPTAIVAANPQSGDNVYAALLFGNQWAGYCYKGRMEALLKDRRPLIYNMHNLWTYAGHVSPRAVLKAITQDKRRIFIKRRVSRKPQEEPFAEGWMYLKPVMQGQQIGLYEIIGPNPAILNRR